MQLVVVAAMVIVVMLVVVVALEIQNLFHLLCFFFVPLIL